MRLTNTKLAFLILMFIIFSIFGNIFVWLKVTGNLAVGKASLGYIGICIDQAPVLQSIPNQNSTATLPFTYQASATDSTNPIYYYGIAKMIEAPVLLSSFSIDRTSGLINFTPTLEEIGNYSIYIWATHEVCGNSSNDSKKFNLSIRAGLAPYWINYTRNFNLTEDELFTLNLSTFAVDPFNESLGFGHNTTQAIFRSFSMSGTGLINFTPNDYDVGWHWVLINVWNARGVSNSSVFKFTVANINDAPNLQPIPDLEACEDSYFYYKVNASDDDMLTPPQYREETLTYSDNTSMFNINDQGEIAFIPSKQDKGLHSIRIHVSDGEYADSTDFLLDVIEVNGAPELGSIGAMTVYTNESINRTITAWDEEDGYASYNVSTPMRFNLTFLSGTKFFDFINSTTGLINFTTNDSLVGTYSIKVWVNDTGIPLPHHPNATSKCGDGNPKSDYEIFSLTVTNRNHPPNITSYYPLEQNFSMQETYSVLFNVTAEDIDNTITTIYWYVNGTVKQITNSLNDSYNFTTDYESAAQYNITVVVSDGNLNDSFEWNVTVTDRAPPTVPIPSGIGGGGGGGACRELWTCNDWSMCQNASVRESMLILGRMYNETMLNCSMKSIAKGNCGFRIRSCTDNKRCGTTFSKPNQFAICIFTLQPTCYDKILNCHDSSCEVLPDCGGPCEPCPTCSDGIKNQGEEYTDCGGPCRPCPVAYPKPPKCGDKRCEIPELFTCITDCGLFWIVMILSAILLWILVAILRREILLGETKEKESELKKSRRHMYNLIAQTQKAIKEKDLTLARHYYSQTKRFYDSLSSEEKKRVYRRIIKLFSDIGKLE